ncbi:MAG: hypothetical protein A4S12_13025 [Proteobacteria bacterium SG_bin5]|nr:hypothetical protein [Sphingomonas sp.]OQW45201.1 MAG: hypothetical protein A4S12_13025 [Proteobacteria bacterium SG_bin5]
MITATSGYIVETLRRIADERGKQCELAAAFLQDETLNPYLDKVTVGKLVRDANMRLQRCLRNG